MTGFIWDTLTLGRIDRLYDRVILSTYMISLSTCLYLYNVADDGYRGYTFKRNIHEGQWRVDVITDEGQIIGIVRFDVVMGLLNENVQMKSVVL